MPRTTEITKLSSHIVGSDHVGRKIDMNPGSPVEGIYGSSGFYFQQRRGRLDLRSLAQIDLEKVVRDVDIDVLQMSLENICFCNLREEDLRFITDQHVVKIFRAAQLVIEYLLYAQEQLADNCNTLSHKYKAKKRSVMKKRKELMELQENSKVLRAQLRSKKKSIKTLEQLLKDKSRNQRTAESPAPREPSPVPQKQRPTVLRFFVSNSNGLCVEFNLRPNTYVYELVKEVKQAFISKRHREDSNSKAEDIQLIYQGKVLLDGNTLEEVSLQPGDTIVAVIPALECEEEADKKSPLVIDDDNKRMEDLERQKQMMEFFSRQQEIMKENWSQLIGKLSEKLSSPATENKNDPTAQHELEAKLASMESAIHHQMRTEFNQMRESMGSMSNKSRFIVGELEDDDDEYQRELERKMKMSNQRLRELEGKLEKSDNTVSELRKLQRAQNEELEELRRLMREFNRQPVVIAPQIEKPQPVPEKRSVVSGGRKEPKANAGKWNQFALSGKRSKPAVQQESSEVSEEIVEVKSELPKQEKPKMRSPPPKSKSPPPSRQSHVTILFPAENMAHLSQVVGIWGQPIELRVPQDISADDLIFEIRSTVAEKANIPLARVSLSVQGTDVFLAMDLPLNLTATGATELIKRGELIIEIRNPITDAQLDSLGVQMESSDNEYLSGDGPKFKKQLEGSLSLRRSLGSNSGSESEKIYSDTIRSYKQSNRGSMKRNYDSDSESEGDIEEDEKIINSYHRSLSSTLVALDDMKGLTDDELESKMSELKSSMEGLPPKLSKNLSGYRGVVPGSVSAAIDSGSEDLSASDDASSRNLHKSKSLRLAPEGVVGKKHSHNKTVGGMVEGIGMRKSGDRSHHVLFSSSLTLSRGSGSARTLRDYDSQDDDEPYIKRNSPPGKLSSQARYSETGNSSGNSSHDSNDSDDRLAQEYLKQYESEMKNSSLTSTSTAEEKREYLASRERRNIEDFKHKPHGKINDGVEDFNDTSSIGSGSPHASSRLSPSHLQDDIEEINTRHSMQSMDEAQLLSTTIDTDISMPMTETQSFDYEESVSKRADKYEKEVHLNTPSQLRPPLDSSSHPSSGVQTPTSSSRNIANQQLHSSKGSQETSSPFDHLASDFDDYNDSDILEGSLDLSQSADAFGSGSNFNTS